MIIWCNRFFALVVPCFLSSFCGNISCYRIGQAIFVIGSRRNSREWGKKLYRTALQWSPGTWSPSAGYCECKYLLTWSFSDITPLTSCLTSCNLRGAKHVPFGNTFTECEPNLIWSFHMLQQVSFVYLGKLSILSWCRFTEHFTSWLVTSVFITPLNGLENRRHQSFP